MIPEADLQNFRSFQVLQESAAGARARAFVASYKGGMIKLKER